MSTSARVEGSPFELAALDLASELVLVASARRYSILEEPGITMPDRRRITVFRGTASGVAEEETARPDLCNTTSLRRTSLVSSRLFPGLRWPTLIAFRPAGIQTLSRAFSVAIVEVLPGWA